MANPEKRGIARWNPFDDRTWFPILSRSSDGDLLDEFWGKRGSELLQPATDITENDKQYVVTAELPGTKRGDVTVEVCDGVLTIHGEKKSEREEKSEKRRYVERSFGSFSRAFTLPADADESHVEALFKDGVLTVTLAKTEARKARTVDVKTA